MIGLLAIAGITYLAVSSAKSADKTQLNGVEKISFPKGTSQAVKDLVLKMAAGENLEGLGWGGRGGRRSAYYSRAGSYSRSYNAEQAEHEDRYPLTRAAKHLGLTTAAFKKGTDHANIGTSEWHHVGKYATRVDYWDVSEESEIYNSYKFWFGAMNRANKAHCMKNIVRIAKQMLAENLKPESASLQNKWKRKQEAIARRAKELHIHQSISIPHDSNLDTKTLKKLKSDGQAAKHEAAKKRLAPKVKSQAERKQQVQEKIMAKVPFGIFYDGKLLKTDKSGAINSTGIELSATLPTGEYVKWRSNGVLGPKGWSYNDDKPISATHRALLRRKY